VNERARRKAAAFISLPFALCYLPFALLSCASSQTALSPGPVAIPGDIAGLVHAGQTNTPEEYALLDRLGASWLLATFYWSRIEPADDQWNFESYDVYVDTARAAGKKIIGILGYDVPWIHENGKSRNYIPSEKMDFFLDYARRTAEHFKGRVDAWCVWNEPNFHFWKGSREEFYELARLAADTVKEADPGVTLLGGAFNRGIFGLPEAYIRGLFESGAMEKADGLAFHPYELNPSRAKKLYGEFQEIAARYGFADRIWITEAGYPTGGLYPTAVSERKFPAYIVKTFVSLSAGGAKKIVWYQLFDPEKRQIGSSEDFFGLVRSRNDYSSKGAEAFRLCAMHLGGTVYRPDLPPREGLPGSLEAFFFERPGGGGALVLWKGGRPLRLTLDGPGGVYTAHDPVTGRAAAVPPGEAITASSMPVFITWQGGNRPPVLKR